MHTCTRVAQEPPNASAAGRASSSRAYPVMPLEKARFGGGSHCIKWCEEARPCLAATVKTNCAVDLAAADQCS